MTDTTTGQAEARCGHMSHHGRCILTPGHDPAIDHLYPTPATPVPAPDMLTALLDKLTEGLADAFPGKGNAARTVAGNLLADHARALADLVQQRIEHDRTDNPGGGQMAARNHARRGGMMSARWVLERYADELHATTAQAGLRR